MVYTQQRRRAMNKAVRALYPDIHFYESPNGIPVMECSTLPAGARRMEDSDELFRMVDSHCVRTNEIGMPMPDYGKALPVFISSMEINGRSTRNFYRVNYVSVSDISKGKAAEYINKGVLYAVAKDTCNP